MSDADFENTDYPFNSFLSDKLKVYHGFRVSAIPLSPRTSLGNDNVITLPDLIYRHQSIVYALCDVTSIASTSYKTYNQFLKRTFNRSVLQHAIEDVP